MNRFWGNNFQRSIGDWNSCCFFENSLLLWKSCLDLVLRATGPPVVVSPPPAAEQYSAVNQVVENILLADYEMLRR